MSKQRILWPAVADLLPGQVLKVTLHDFLPICVREKILFGHVLKPSKLCKYKSSYLCRICTMKCMPIPRKQLSRTAVKNTVSAIMGFWRVMTILRLSTKITYGTYHSSKSKRHFSKSYNEKQIVELVLHPHSNSWASFCCFGFVFLSTFAHMMITSQWARFQKYTCRYHFERQRLTIFIWKIITSGTFFSMMDIPKYSFVSFLWEIRFWEFHTWPL